MQESRRFREELVLKKQIDRGMAVFAFVTIAFLVICSMMYYITKSPTYLTLLMFTPAISVIISKLICKEKINDLYLKPRFKNNAKWYICSYFLTPFIALFGTLIYFLIFKDDFNPLGSRYAIEAGIVNTKDYVSGLLVLIPLAILVNPIMGILQCLGEELAWRSYLLPRLSKRYSIRSAVLINGVIWGIWHSPIIAMGYNYGNEHPFLGILAMILFCMIIGIISSYLFYKTESVWCSVLFHASINGMDKWAPSSMFMSEDANKFIGPDLLGIIGGIGFVVIASIAFFRLREIKEYRE